MIQKENLNKLTPYIWEIPVSFRADMRVPTRIIASEEMLEELFRDKSIDQLVNVSTLPGIQKAAYVMPDVHEGYGFPIGGLAATLYPDGVISPGGIGYDINCGVRLLKTKLKVRDIKGKESLLAKKLFEEIPSGVGKGGRLKPNMSQLDDVLTKGAGWMVENGYGSYDDLQFLESNGCLSEAEPGAVSEHAKLRGKDQLGTLGSGNHFVEVETVEEVYDTDIAEKFGLSAGQIVVLIHCGSRGLGHQVATDYIRLMLQNLQKHGITLPDRELACAPLSSVEGRNYFGAMCAAANYAWANRQMIAWEAGNVFSELFGEVPTTLYDVAHNIAKIEDHQIDGELKKVIVHRKGATRAFGPGSHELSGEFKSTGQPVLIPGSMGTASYVLAGTNEGMLEAFGSSCHGAGRKMSRHAALKKVEGQKLKAELEYKGIFVRSGSLKGLAEEAPLAYKDVNEVVSVVKSAGIARKVAKLRPLVVIKG